MLVQPDGLPIDGSITHFSPADVIMKMAERQSIFRIGSLQIDRAGFEVRVGEQELRLTRKEDEMS